MKKYTSLLFFFLSAVPLALQADDFGLRTEVGATKSLGSGFSVDAGLDYRMQDNWKAVDRWGIGVGLNYKPVKFLKIGAAYTYIYSYKTESRDKNFSKKGTWRGYNVDHAYWRSKNRFTLLAAGSTRIGRLDFSLREMVQITRYLSTTTTEDKLRFSDPSTQTGLEKQASETERKPAKTKQYLRSRLGVEWDIKHSPFIPYAQFELYNSLDNGFSADKRRWAAGVEYKISKQHRLSLGYVYDNGADDDNNSNIHCLEVGYKFKF